MPLVEVEHRNSTNTAAGGQSLAGALDVSYRKTKNGFGSVSFDLLNSDSALGSVGRGSIVRARLNGTARVPYRIERVQPNRVSVKREGAERTTLSGRHLMAEWADGRIHMPPTLTNLAETDPVLDDRVMAWYGPDYDPTGAGWTAANIIAVQGWASTFYTGLPSGWADPAALWIGPNSGDDDNAPAGINLFHRWLLVGKGNHVLDFAGDNFIVAYLNGKQIGSGNDFQRKQFYPFEVTREGWLYIAFKLTNAEDDGPPGGNPTALLWSLRHSASGTVVARSDADTMILEYPASIPIVPIGHQIRQARSGNDILNGWTITGTVTHDETGAPYPDPGVMSFRIGSDTPWDLIQAHIDAGSIDVIADVDGRVLRPRVKNVGSTKALPLVAGYSTAGKAAPGTVNLRELQWDLPKTPFTALSVRWAHGRFTVPYPLPANAVWGFLDLAHIEDKQAAINTSVGLLGLYAAGVDVATIELRPVDTTQLPFAAFDVHDKLNVPGRTSLDTTDLQEVVSIQVDADTDGTGIYRIELGSPWKDRITRLERAGRRSGSIDGLATSASPSTTINPTPTLTRQSEWTLFVTDAGSSVGTETPHPANLPAVAQVISLRMRGNKTPATGTTTVQVKRNGATAVTLSMAAGADLDVELVGDVWVTSDLVTVAPVADGGHTGVTIQASVSEVIQ